MIIVIYLWFLVVVWSAWGQVEIGLHAGEPLTTECNIPGGIVCTDETTGVIPGSLLPYPTFYTTTPPLTCDTAQQIFVNNADLGGKYEIGICTEVGAAPLTAPSVSKIDQISNGVAAESLPAGQDGTLVLPTFGISRTGNVITATLPSVSRQIAETLATISVANSTTETTVFTTTIPANTIGTHGFVYARVFGDAFNNSGSTVDFTYRVKYGTTTHVCRINNVGTTTTRSGVLVEAFLQADGTNAQWISCNASQGSNASRVSVPEAITVTQSSDQNFVVTMQMSLANANADFHIYHGHATFMP